jgi:PAS domain S-box-containing protein
MDQLTHADMLKKISELEETVATYRTLVEDNPDLIYRTDLEGRITLVSPSVKRLSGYTMEEVIGMKIADEIYLFPEERSALLETLQDKGHVFNFEAQLKRKDGSIWWASTNAHLLKNKDGNVIGVGGVTRDISEIKAAENALRESEERFRLAFQTSPDAINLNRAEDGLYIDINDGFTQLTGYTREDVIGRTSLSLNIWSRAEDRQRLIEGLTTNGFVENLEAEFKRKNGEIGIGLMSARMIKINEENVILSITRDITEYKKMEEVVVQSEKMLSVGGLAAGMAHEINNPLAGIMQNASVVINRLSGDHPKNREAAAAAGTNMAAICKYLELRSLPNLLENIRNSCSMAADIVKNMLSFARKSENVVSSHDISVLLNHAVDLLRTDYDMKKHYDFKKIKIICNYDDSIGPIPCEASKLQQVFVNVLKNGAEAMAETGDGSTEPTFNLTIRDEEAWVRVEIKDNGPGIDAKTRRRIFEPFFTTKPMGKGTGLGLSVSYFIITENHGGEINVDVAQGGGTCFVLRLQKDRT